MSGIRIPDSIELRTTFTRKVTVSQLYNSILYAARSFVPFARNKKSQLVDDHFLEHLQLAVTEVSACAVCSYAHTQMALKMGMSNAEINSFLTGDPAYQKTDEAKAMAFAQHYAETRGLPEKETFQAVIDEYGQEKARIILAAIQLMLAGNMIGLPMSAYRARRKGKPYSDSSPGYEWGMMLLSALFLPVGFVHGFVRWLLRRPFF